MIPAVILAGGLSRRMGGGDKTLMALDDRPILAHVIDRLAPQAGPLAINANADPARFAGFGLPVLADPVAGHPGPLAGILAAMDWAASLGADRVVTVPGDTPFLPADLVERLAAHPCAIARTTRPQPTVGIWPVASRDALSLALAGGMRKLTLWAEAAGAVEVTFPEAGFFNVNTPEDLAAARAREER